MAESVYLPEKLSLRVRNLDAEPIKVNDKTGNPIMIGMVLVWKLKDTYKAISRSTPRRWQKVLSARLASEPLPHR